MFPCVGAVSLLAEKENNLCLYPDSDWQYGQRLPIGYILGDIFHRIICMLVFDSEESEKLTSQFEERSEKYVLAWSIFTLLAVC